MDHSRFLFFTNGLDTSPGLTFLLREGELILRASLPFPTTTSARAIIALACGVTPQFAGGAYL